MGNEQQQQQQQQQQQEGDPTLDESKNVDIVPLSLSNHHVLKPSSMSPAINVASTTDIPCSKLLWQQLKWNKTSCKNKKGDPFLSPASDQKGSGSSGPSDSVNFTSYKNGTRSFQGSDLIPKCHGRCTSHFTILVNVHVWKNYPDD